MRLVRQNVPHVVVRTILDVTAGAKLKVSPTCRRGLGSRPLCAGKCACIRASVHVGLCAYVHVLASVWVCRGEAGDPEIVIWSNNTALREIVVAETMWIHSVWGHAYHQTIQICMVRALAPNFMKSFNFCGYHFAHTGPQLGRLPGNPREQSSAEA